MDSLKELLTPDQQVQYDKKVAIEMPKGFGTFHHPLMVHGSYENNSDISRRAMVLNVFADGTLSNSNEEMLPGIPITLVGQKMEGQFYPLLFDPSKI